jgi:ATP phosphoribosyltransferase regulatory subunit
MKGASGEVLNTLNQLEVNFPALKDSANLIEARLEALTTYGLNINELPFEASFGRATMEYYDGFVFGFFDGENNIASGGRYDALTTVLGQGKSIPAVGGVIRPDALAAVTGDAA